jgi:glutaminyl-peptide cyclotransferase
MATAESRLRDLSILRSKPSRHFLPEFDKPSHNFGGYILDDHMPFMARGVEILHIIPSPFPSVWHTMEDDGEHLDIPTTSDWALIVTAFVGGWMELEGFFPNPVELGAHSKRMKVKSKTEL